MILFYYSIIVIVHCWDYRRFIVRFGKISTMDEFRFTSKKILDNFSNFSSWHYRSSLFRQLLTENYDRQELRTMVDKDFETVKNAIFTDPNDQSPWLYLRWLIDFEQNLLFLDDNHNDGKECCLQIKQFIWSQNHHLLAIEFSESIDRFPLEIKINDEQINFDSFVSKFNGTIWLGRYVDLPKSLKSIEFLHNGTTILNRKFDVNIDQHFHVYNRDDDDVDFAAKRKLQTDLARKRIEDLNVLLEIEQDSKCNQKLINTEILISNSFIN